jgi:hypothetical protein
MDKMSIDDDVRHVRENRDNEEKQERRWEMQQIEYASALEKLRGEPSHGYGREFGHMLEWSEAEALLAQIEKQEAEIARLKRIVEDALRNGDDWRLGAAARLAELVAISRLDNE